MKVNELRAYLKEKGVKGYSTMKKMDLQEKVKELQEKKAKEEYEKQLRENVVCRDCLEQQRIQRKIDEKQFNQRLSERIKRILVCVNCQHPDLTRDGDDTFCLKCGALQDPDAEVSRY